MSINTHFFTYCRMFERAGSMQYHSSFVNFGQLSIVKGVKSDKSRGFIFIFAFCEAY